LKGRGPLRSQGQGKKTLFPSQEQPVRKKSGKSGGTNTGTRRNHRESEGGLWWGRVLFQEDMRPERLRAPTGHSLGGNGALKGKVLFKDMRTDRQKRGRN